MDEQIQTETSLRMLNESAIREHALECSAKYRAGKFTRVGEDFINEVKADVECLVRELRNKYPTLHPALHSDEVDVGYRFVTGLLIQKFQEELERAIGRLIQNKVQKQPTVGKTLGRTR